MAAVTPRMREYLNNTHKKRAARQREKLARTETRVRLTPKGWLYWNSQSEPQLAKYWEEFSPKEKALIQFMCDTGIEPGELYQLWYFLFDKS